ncbi:hypothetical protein KEM48_010387 [Puccinia striiformis f. sp. tritici PST-130]|nr:hypothetical protein KEM48_010387 [Puccinia striiformis f. sp. tritici PST-130]
MALNHWLEPRSRRLRARKRKHVSTARDLRKPFSAAVDLYRQLEDKRQEIVNVVIQLTPQEVLAFQSCPACFGPEPPNSADYPETTRARLVVCLDANFQQRHQMKAGPKSEVLRTPRIFLSQSLLDSVSEHIREQEAQGMAPQQRNPHRSGRNYSVRFFNKQWSKQRTFHADDTQNEHDRRQRLVEFYVREATLEHMRTRLRSPEIFLATVEEVDQLMNSIVAESARLSDQLVELTGAGLLGTGIGTDEEEEKLRLLLWDAKSKLFVEAVHLQAEREPLNNSHIMGSHLGTKGKENIIKALQNRRPAVKKIIDSFNRLYSTFQEKFPNRRLSDSHHHPLTYDVFKEWPMDHAFWTDGLYYHSDAPWSTDPNVREGINCILILGRIQEEFELLAQELARAMGWAVATYTRFTETVDYITSRITLINTDPTTVADDLDDDNITWLWKRCQPTGNNNHFQQWLAIVEQANLLHLTRNRSHADDVDDWIEEAVLDEGLDDGDDAEENLIYQFEALRPPGQVANNDHAESRPAPALED